MDTAMVWIIVMIVVALVAIGVLAFFISRGTGQRREARHHEQAEKMRAQARESAVAAEDMRAQRMRTQADAATAAAEAERAKARAAQAEVDARRYTEEHRREAEQHSVKAEELHRKADDLDPYARGDREPVAAGATSRTADAATRRSATETPAATEAGDKPDADDPDRKSKATPHVDYP